LVGRAITMTGLVGASSFAHPDAAVEVLSSILDASTEHSMIATDPNGVVVLWNEGARRLYGYASSDIVGQSWSVLHTDEDVRQGLPQEMIDCALRDGKWEGTIGRVRPDGGTFTAHVVTTPRFDANGGFAGFLLISSDITEQVRVSRDLETMQHDDLLRAKRQSDESLTLLETLQSTAPVGFGFVDREFRIQRMNATLAAVNGLPVDEQLGRTVAEVIPELWPDIEPVYRKVLATGRPVVNLEQAGEAPAAPGEVRSWLASYYPVRVRDEIIGIGLVVVDITERKQAEDFRSVVMDNMVEGLAATDCEGRLAFMNAAACRMLGWTDDELRGKSMHAAVHFQHGDGSPHPQEDCELMRVVTDRKAITTTDDAFTRKDGSIFPVACSAAPLMNDDDTVRGMVVAFRDITEEKAEQLRVQRELNALTWLGRIRDALDDERFVLYSQPIVPLKDGGEGSEELLLRMLGRNDEVILPGSFLPPAESYGLVREIDEWVITQAIRLAATGKQIKVNLSAESVGSRELLRLIERELSAAGAPPANLVFEITETTLMKDLAAGEACTRGLVDLGCSVALDDFGTGFGSFTYLKYLPIAYLKIDIEFVRDLTTNPASEHVVKAIVSLAQGFGQQTIAEGVEDAETLELLREYGVDFAQGFHLGRPAALDTDG
jgi:PAS domain S-box-containing protein